MTGTVSSVSGSHLTVKVTSLGSGSSSTSRAVTTTAKTTYRSSATTTSSAVVKGMCVAATGSKTSTGIVDAIAVTVSAPTRGSCPAVTASGLGVAGQGAPGA